MRAASVTTVPVAGTLGRPRAVVLGGPPVFVVIVVVKRPGGEVADRPDNDERADQENPEQEPHPDAVSERGHQST